MQRLLNMLKPDWWRFEWRYWRKQTPWDTQVTPPEVMAFLEEAEPGHALDLGCGTGTNAITMAEYGWRVTAVDFSIKAIHRARRKSAAAGHTIAFHEGDVAQLDFLKGPFGYALDIGCLFSLTPMDQARYVEHLSRMLSLGARYMLYAWLPLPWPRLRG